jgi:hypothetical protein
MNRDEFIEYIESPDKLNGDHVEDLKGLLQEYPYFQTAHMLLVKALDNLKDLKFGNQLKVSAAHIGDRHILFNLVHQHKYSGFTQADKDIKTGAVDLPDDKAGTASPASEAGIYETSLPETEVQETAQTETPETGISDVEVRETDLSEAGVPETEKPETTDPETAIPEKGTPGSAIDKEESLAERVLREIEHYKKSRGPDREPPEAGSEAGSPAREAGSEAGSPAREAGLEADMHPAGADSKPDEGSSQPEEDFDQDVFLIDEESEAGDRETGNPEIPVAGRSPSGVAADAELLEIDKSPGEITPARAYGPEDSSDLSSGPDDAAESRASGPVESSGRKTGLDDPEDSSNPETGSGDVAESRASGPDDAVEKKNQKKPLNTEIESHSFSEWLDMFQPDYEQYGQSAESEPARRSPEHDLIDRFLREKPRIEPRSPLDDTDPPVDLAARVETIQDEFLTETLARIYVQQKHYKRAIYAYEKLCLKYPEKYSYFADQIDGIKRFINPDN